MRNVTLFSLIVFSTLSHAQNRPMVRWNELHAVLPSGWSVKQQADTKGIQILAVGNGSDYMTLYSDASSRVDLKSMISTEAKITNDGTEIHGPVKWAVIESVKKGSRAATSAVTSFATDYNGSSYYGFSRSSQGATQAKANAQQLLKGLIYPLRSLTPHSYTGKKYYFGWGAAAQWDPSMMHNEVKYDVLHTHDFFTKEMGGLYLGGKLTGYAQATQSAIRAEWTKLGQKITSEDMYVQYSSGHGYEEGLGVGVTYNEMRDVALNFPAREIIIFTMACHSGGLIDSFNKMKSKWQDWESKGRTLFVMGSSRTDENSSTGPSTDPDEPQGPSGSAGSAFGHALWKAIIGNADGELDGIQDGFLTLEEIRSYTIWKTQDIGGHTPQSTGVYNPNLIMSQVPSKAWVDSLEYNSDRLSDEEVSRQLQNLLY